MEQVTRRSFVLLTAGGAVAIALPGCGWEAGLSEEDREALLRMARLLYPHDALADGVYQEVLQPIEDRADRASAYRGMIRDGLAELDLAAGGTWLMVSRDDQVEALERIESTAFFEAMQSGVRTRLYDNRTVWELIGFEGSSVEHGGYLRRGFDDIDWLPED